MGIVLPAERSSVARARANARAALSRCEPELLDTVVLLVSEVVTNAVLHADSEVELTVTVSETTVRVEVSDSSVVMPKRRRALRTDTNGRGLELVELLASDWGVTGRSDGKTVWFEVRREQASTPLTGELGASLVAAVTLAVA